MSSILSRCPVCRQRKGEFMFRKMMPSGCFYPPTTKCNKCILEKKIKTQGSKFRLTEARKLYYGYVRVGGVLCEYPPHVAAREAAILKLSERKPPSPNKVKRKPVQRTRKSIIEHRAAVLEYVTKARAVKEAAELASEAKRKAYWDNYHAKLAEKQLEELLK